MVTDMLGRKGYMSTSAPTPCSIEKGCLGLGNSANLPSFRGAAVKEIQLQEPREGEAVH